MCVPSLSVIIPTYNRAWILKEAIDSVLAQDFRDFEIVVVDDGSSDNTPEILESYQQTLTARRTTITAEHGHPAISSSNRNSTATKGTGRRKEAVSLARRAEPLQQICAVRQGHRGVSAARNAGLARATGRLITFLDSDDLWLPGKLSAQVAFFNAHPDALICQTEEIWIKNGIRVNPKKRHKKYSGMIFERCLELCIVSPSAVMMRRCLFDKIGGFDETLPVCEDYDLWLRVACRFPVYLIETPFVIKRGGHPDQLSRTPCMDRFRIHVLKKILETDLLSSRQYCAADAALKKKCAIYAAGCLKRGRVQEANYYMRLSRGLATQGLRPSTPTPHHTRG